MAIPSLSRLKSSRLDAKPVTWGYRFPPFYNILIWLLYLTVVSFLLATPLSQTTALHHPRQNQTAMTNVVNGKEYVYHQVKSGKCITKLRMDNAVGLQSGVIV